MVKHDLVKFGVSTAKPKEEVVKHRQTITVETQGTAVVFKGASWDFREILKSVGQGIYSKEVKG